MNPQDLTFFAIIAIFLAFIIYSNKKKKDAAIKLSNSVVIGAKVVMRSGMIGTVSAISDDTVTIESTPGTKVEFMKAAVATVLEAPAVKQSASKKKTSPASKSTK